jgi:hypothetical protein
MRLWKNAKDSSASPLKRYQHLLKIDFIIRLPGSKPIFWVDKEGSDLQSIGSKSLLEKILLLITR